MNNVLFTNIQRFSLHDGPGIRTTVFLKGCSLRCPWCANPENIEPYPQEYSKDGYNGVFGKYIDLEQLFQKIIKDKPFYDGNINNQNWSITDASQIKDLPGGVTFSGGEPLLQIAPLISLLDKLKKERIHISVETCLFVTRRQLELALEYVDFFYVDLKILNKTQCREILKGNIALFISNLDTLLRWKNEKGERKPVVFRIPVIGGFTDSNNNRAAIKDMLTRYREEANAPLKIELIKGHNLGENKYRSLGIQQTAFYIPEDSFMNAYKEELSDLGIPIDICKI